MPKKNNVLVKESNAIAKAELIPAPETIWEERLIAKVVSFNRVDDMEFQENLVTIGELVEKHPSGHQLKQIDRAITNLSGARFKVKISPNEFSLYPVFAVIHYKDRKIKAKLNPELKPHYLQLKREFALRNLPEFNALSTIYGQQLFRYLSAWRNVEEGEATIPLKELHSALSATETAKKDFMQFRLRVLEPGRKEILEKTSLWFEWEPVREGQRKVVAIRFVFNPKVFERDKKLEELGNRTKSEYTEQQKKSNECFERSKALGESCKPKKRSLICKFCFERGRMYAFSNLLTPAEEKAADGFSIGKIVSKNS